MAVVTLLSTERTRCAILGAVLRAVVFGWFVALGTVATASAEPSVIYLNYDGVTVSPGTNDSRTDRSSLVTARVSLPPWSASAAAKDEVTRCVQDLYARFQVTITTTPPDATVSHVESVVTDSAMRFGSGSTAAGLAPFRADCGVIDNAMVFTFTTALPGDDLRAICETQAQEIAHAFGLDHVLLPEDPMTYLPYAGERSFQDIDAECGEQSPRPCGPPATSGCRARQNSVRLLAERLGVTAPLPGPSEATGGCATSSPSSGWLLLALVPLLTRRRA